MTEMTPDCNDKGRWTTGWRLVPGVIVIGGLALGYMMGWHYYLSLGFLSESQIMQKRIVAENPVAAPLGFVAFYTLAVAFSFPAASILTIFGGFLFGWLFGGTLAILGATAGATALFITARLACSDHVRKRLCGRAGKLSEGFEKNAFGYLLALRIAPFVPFFMVNIAPALFHVRLSTFVAATFIGIMPGAFAYAWLGQGCDSVLDAARHAGQQVTLRDLVTPQITIAFVALALVAILATIVKRAWATRVQ
jgi:uncharacterized membrane protein YdjX (TVP38/TMEM64 family)